MGSEQYFMTPFRRDRRDRYLSHIFLRRRPGIPKDTQGRPTQAQAHPKTAQGHHKGSPKEAKGAQTTQNI